MTLSRAEMHRKQEARLDTLRQNRAGVASYRVPADSADSTSHAAHAILEKMLNEHAADMAAREAPVGVSERETGELLAQLRTRWDGERMDALLGDCRDAVLRAIAGPFGFGRVLAAANTVGGNVTAVHNAGDGAGERGLQQAVGRLLTEFLTASFDEVLDAYKKGMRGDTASADFVEALRKRLARIVKRVAAKWQDTVAVFRDGAISGFLGNLATMLVDMLATTGKRVVRVIREGMMAILSALKLALFPPKGMTRAQAGDAAQKLLATGLATSLGIMAEGAAEKAITALIATHLPLLAPLAGPVAAVLVATMTGLASALLMYGIERLDLFGVRRQREYAAVLAELDREIVEGDRRIDAMVDSVLDDADLRLPGVG